MVPPEQLAMVCSHTPRPQVVLPRPSSGVPSQSLSSPSHTSPTGMMAPEQEPQEPVVHSREPAWHCPVHTKVPLPGGFSVQPGVRPG